MRSIHRLSVLCLILACVAAGTPADLPTTAQLHQLFDKKQYPQCLQQISRVMQLKGDLAAKYDSFELLILRGDTLLELKNFEPAASAYADARKAAADGQHAALARAKELMVRACPHGSYQPKTTSDLPDPQPMSTLDISLHAKIFQAMYDDRMRTAKGTIKDAAASDSLLPMVGAVEDLADLNALEFAATGKDAETGKMLIDVAFRAMRLMDKELGREESSVLAIAFEAAQTVNGRVARGLDSDKLAKLKSISSTSSRIQNAAAEAHDIATRLGKKDWLFGHVIDRAQRVHDRADEIVKTYTGARAQTAGR